jgi:hypothetical protein
MNPISKKIMNKLSKEDKTELKSEKIELALVDDLRDLIQRGRKIESGLKSELNSFNGLLRAGNGVKDRYSEIEKAANELGIDVPSDVKKLVSIADDFIKKGKALQKVYNLF